MMLAPVRLIPELRQARKALGLSPENQKTIRSWLRLEPLAGDLCYPTTSTLGKFPKSGVYKRGIEFRTRYGMPMLTDVWYLFVDNRMPLFAFDLVQVWPKADPRALSMAEMELAEKASHHMSKAYGDLIP